jgi:hypothetical protein
MKVTPSDVGCDAGGTAAVQVRVQNTGTVIDDLVVEVLGDARDWATAEPKRLPLAPGQEATTTVPFHPPRGPEPPAGASAAGIKVTSGANAAVTAQQPVQVAIRPFTELSLVLRPERAEDSRPKAFELWLLNEGNVAIDGLSIAGSDKEEQLAVRTAAQQPAAGVGPQHGHRRLASACSWGGRSPPFEPRWAATISRIGRSVARWCRSPHTWWLLAIVTALRRRRDHRQSARRERRSSTLIAAIAALGLVLALVLAGLAMITGALGRLLKPGPDPMTTGATFLVGLGGVVAAVIFGLLGVALLGGAGALLAIPGALVAAVLLVGALAQRRSDVPPTPPRPPTRPR